MIEFIKSSWKQVAGIVGVLAIITSILTFDARYAKSGDIVKLETNVVNTIQEVKKSFELQQNITRLNSISDQLMKTKLLIKQYPKDAELQEDYESLKLEKVRLQRKVESGSK